jgi:hypothetical protein
MTQALSAVSHLSDQELLAARRFPVILDLLSDGSITLTTVTLLAPHLTPENNAEVLETAHHKSKRDVEHIVARLRPQRSPPGFRVFPLRGLSAFANVCFASQDSKK